MATRHVALAVTVLAVLLLPSWPVGFASADHEDGHKDFESHDVLDTLDSGWLISESNGNVNARVTGQNNPLGERAWAHEAVGGGTPSQSALTSSLIDTGCNGVTMPDLEVSVKIVQAPTADVYFGIGATTSPDLTRPDRSETLKTTVHHQLRFKLDAELNLTPQIHGDQNGRDTNQEPPILVEGAPIGPLNTGQFYTIQIANILCESSATSQNVNVGVRFKADFIVVEEESIRQLDTGFTLAWCRSNDDGFTSCSAPNADDNQWHDFYTKSEDASPAEYLLYDNIRWGSVAVAGVDTDSIAVTGLLSMDVDDTGSTGIYRWGGGANVSAFSATGMNEHATVVDTNCNRFGGIAALQTHVSYLNCEAGDPNNVNEIHIRSNTLGAPAFGDICADGDFCTAEILDEDSSAPEDDVAEFASVTHVPFDFSDGTTAGRNRVDAAWAFSTTDGGIGIVTYSWNNDPLVSGNHIARSDVASANIASQEPDAVCVTEDNDDRVYLYGASTQTGTYGYRASFDIEDSGGGGTIETLTVDLTQVFGSTSTTNNALGVGCGEGKFAALTTDTLSVWNCRECSGNSPIVTMTGLSGTTSRGVAMSDNGRWVTWADSAGVNVACTDTNGCFNVATNETAALGETVYTTPMPSGTFRDLRIQGNGSALWIATSDTIERHDIFTVTNGQDASYNPAIEVIDGDGGGGGGSGGGVVEDNAIRNLVIDSGEGVFGSTGALVFAAVTMIVLAFAGTLVAALDKTGKWKLSLAMAVGAGIMAFLLTIAWGLLPEWFAFILTVLVLGLIFGAVLIGRRVR